MKRYNKGDKVVSKKCFDIDINGYLTQICEGDIGTVDWDSGEPEIDVYFGNYVRLSVGRQDIEPCDTEPEDEVTIEGEIYRDKDGGTYQPLLRVHKVSCGDYESVWNSGEPEYELGDELFPNLSPESDPIECKVTITIKPKKK